MLVRSSYQGSVGGTMLPINLPRPAKQVPSNALWSIACRMAWRTRMSLKTGLELLKDSTTSPFVVPSITWYLLLLVNWLSDSGACTVPITLIVPVSSALFSGVGSLKYFSVTWLKNGFVPQYASLRCSTIESPRFHEPSLYGPVP